MSPSVAVPELRAALERLGPWQEARTAGDAIAQALVAADDAMVAVEPVLDRAQRIVVSGAGSSYHVAQVAAAGFREVGRAAIAVPLSELLLRPRPTLGALGPPVQPVFVVSRSGTTTEAVRAAQALAAAGHPIIAVTGVPDGPLAAAAALVLSAPLIAERSIVMTRSFSAMTAALLRVAARAGGDTALATDLDALPGVLQGAPAAAAIGHAIMLAAAAPSRVVVLGGGAALGIALEAVLKLTETGQVPANAWEPWEFRHGPISVCEPGMLVVGVLPGDAPDEAAVLDACRALGATTWALGAGGPGEGLRPLARLPALLAPLQALALTVAIQRGRDPEAPRHLGKVVVLADP